MRSKERRWVVVKYTWERKREEKESERYDQPVDETGAAVEVGLLYVRAVGHQQSDDVQVGHEARRPNWNIAKCKYMSS